MHASLLAHCFITAEKYEARFFHSSLYFKYTYTHMKNQHLQLYMTSY